MKRLEHELGLAAMVVHGGHSLGHDGIGSHSDKIEPERGRQEQLLTEGVLLKLYEVVGERGRREDAGEEEDVEGLGDPWAWLGA